MFGGVRRRRRRTRSGCCGACSTGSRRRRAGVRQNHVCYHTTEVAEDILRAGFRDATGSYGLLDSELTGVFLGDSPMGINEGATGDQVLRVEFPDAVDLADYELVEDFKPHREWCVPAALINERATVTLMTDDEVDELAIQNWVQRRSDL